MTNTISSDNDATSQALSTPDITETTSFWKISPGENAHLWPQCRDGNYIAIGWPAIGDARGILLDEIETRRLAVLQNPDHADMAQWYTPGRVKQLWRFANEIKTGDRIVANRGTSEVLGLGIVTGQCEFHPEDAQYPHRLPVEWISTSPLAVTQGGWMRTLIELDAAKFNSFLSPNSPPEKTNAPMKTHPLNQILYGPPGTGKTYNTIRRAVEIIEGVEYSDHAAAKTKFDELRAQGRIEFVTFHQSFGYEDFVEGIRPVMDGSTQAGARYEVRDGILKQVSLLALGRIVQSIQSVDTSFEDVWNQFEQQIELDPDLLYDGLTAKSSFILTVHEHGIEGKNILSSSPNNFFSCSRTNAEQVWTHFPGSLKVNSSDVYKVLPKVVGHAAFIATVANILKGFSKTTVSTFEDNLNFQRIAQSFLYNSQNYELKTERNNFVLIIDEINRGNISKILGELITLLEPDKRIGGQNALKLTLPVSGEVFGLPPNLFIIGTMNTADKSLALLDIALRRRFKFEEMPPQFSLCANLSPSTRQILETLNARITLRKDRDHRIGHSFFMDAVDAEFDGIFKSEILPLLQEYFFNDWDGLRFVLNESGDNGNFIRALAGRDEDGARNRWQWFFDEGNSSLNCLDQLRANYQISP